MTPPFFTASFSRASAAVVPGPPQVPTPMASRISATESPIGRRRRERQVQDAQAARRAAATPRAPCSSPARVILNAVRLDGLGHRRRCRRPSAGRPARRARRPGPIRPRSPLRPASPEPWNAPAMKGLSSTALQNTTSLPAPMHWRSAVALGRGACTMLRHLVHGVHVDARAGGAHVHARADVVGDRQRMRNGVHELEIGRRRLPCARAR